MRIEQNHQAHSKIITLNAWLHTQNAETTLHLIKKRSRRSAALILSNNWCQTDLEHHFGHSQWPSHCTGDMDAKPHLHIWIGSSIHLVSRLRLRVKFTDGLGYRTSSGQNLPSPVVVPGLRPDFGSTICICGAVLRGALEVPWGILTPLSRLYDSLAFVGHARSNDNFFYLFVRWSLFVLQILGNYSLKYE